MRHERALVAEGVLQKLRPLVLTWLEAAVLLHHYTYGFTVAEVAEKTNKHVVEVAAAKKTLVRKCAVALGYVDGEVQYTKVEPTKLEKERAAQERRAKVADLYRQGLKTSEIAKRLNTTRKTVNRDLQTLRRKKQVS